MKRFQYQLDPLLKYRANRRDLCRQALAQILAADEDLLQQKNRIQKEYQTVEGEIKQMGQRGHFDVDRVSSRRFHLGQLKVKIRIVDENRRQLAEKIKLCRLALVEADQDVKVLEKIRTRKQDEHTAAQVHEENLEREEAWRATQF